MFSDISLINRVFAFKVVVYLLVFLLLFVVIFVIIVIIIIIIIYGCHHCLYFY